MIVPNIGDKVVLMRLGKFALSSRILKVNSFDLETKTWEVDIQNNSGSVPLYFYDAGAPINTYDSVPARLINKHYPGNEWELAEGQK